MQLKRSVWLCLLSTLCFCLPVLSAKELASKAELYEGPEYASAFKNPEDHPDRPNVLLIGDSISNAYTVDVRRQLKGKADVFRIPGNGKNTAYGLKKLDQWLAMDPGKWDVIHFNWGLWDLCYRNPESKTQGYRDKVNGTITATPEQYRANMEQIVARLKETGAALIWCATTPVPEGEAGRKLGDDIKYNQIAAEIMKANGVVINDLHSHALLKYSEIQKQKGDVHYSAEGSSYLAEKVAREITSVLPEASGVRQLPNFILILTDDQGYGDLSCQGSETIQTPHIDRMAADGIRFTDFHAPAAVCTPSRAGIMTGCYPERVGLNKVLFPGSKIKKDPQGRTAGLNPSEITIARLLKTKGYSTGCVGKWHLGDDPKFMPNNHGFDEYFGLPYSNDMVPPRFPDLPLMRDGEVIEVNPDQDTLTRLYTEESLAFIDRNQSRPFFLFLSHSMPHRACHASEAFTQRFSGEQMKTIKPGEDKPSRDFLYPAAVEEIDWSTGAILQKLRELGLDENTLVVFTSDNGPMTGSAGPLRGKKGSLFEGGSRVPGIMQWVGYIPAGTVCNEMATGMDLLPTFAALAGIEVPNDRVIDGKNIRPLLENGPEAKSPHEVLFYAYGAMAVREGQWKLIGGKKPALFDMSQDVGEKKNLAAQYPEVVQHLCALLEAFKKDLKTTGRPAGNLNEESGTIDE